MPNNNLKGQAFEWIKDAESDLAIACVKPTAKIRRSHLSFHAQQAAEKAIKALFVLNSIQYPHTHDLAFLIDALPDSVTIPPLVLSLPILTKYAVQYRYPGQHPSITLADLKEAIKLAKDTVDWVKNMILTA